LERRARRDAAASPAALPGGPAPAGPDNAPLGRRLGCIVYETLLVFAIVFFAGGLFGVLFRQGDATNHRHALSAWLALVTAAYFIRCWTHGGQTLPMRTWRLRLVARDGAGLRPARAALRYLTGWLGWLPPLALHPLSGHAPAVTLLAALLWFAALTLDARRDPMRRYVYDRLAGTRMIRAPA
jgi:uncharacterized RDD family membrane protein YckC